jgi:hypothetical protein
MRKKQKGNGPGASVILKDKPIHVQSSDDLQMQFLYFAGNNTKNAELILNNIEGGKKSNFCKTSYKRLIETHSVRSKKEIIDSVRAILQLCNNFDINSPDADGDYPLNLAVTSRIPDLVKIIIESGANVNYVDRTGWTALQQAIIMDSLPVVETLLNNEAEINIPGTLSIPPPLHLAVMTNNLDIIRILLKNKANINIASYYIEYTPLHLAIIEKKLDVIQILLENNPDIFIKDRSGKTPYDYATDDATIKTEIDKHLKKTEARAEWAHDTEGHAIDESAITSTSTNAYIAGENVDIPKATRIGGKKTKRLKKLRCQTKRVKSQKINK